MTVLRWARPEERGKIQSYLFENMGKIPHERWLNILDCRWNKVDEKYGVVVEEGGKLSGFLGIIFADRQFAGQPYRTGNITSWFLEKHLRRGGLGQEMLSLITELQGVTYTAISANFRSGTLLKKIGWQQLEDTRLFWSWSDSMQPQGSKLVSGTVSLGGKLEKEHACILNDHDGLNLTPHLLSSENGDSLFFVTYKKHKGGNSTAHHEILYSSNPEMLTKHVRDIANRLLEGRNSVLSSDKRFLSAGVIADDYQSLQVPRYYKPQENVGGRQVDFLYGEVVLLDLKIY